VLWPSCHFRHLVTTVGGFFFTPVSPCPSVGLQNCGFVVRSFWNASPFSKLLPGPVPSGLSLPITPRTILLESPPRFHPRGAWPQKTVPVISTSSSPRQRPSLVSPASTKPFRAQADSFFPYCVPGRNLLASARPNRKSGALTVNSFAAHGAPSGVLTRHHSPVDVSPSLRNGDAPPVKKKRKRDPYRSPAHPAVSAAKTFAFTSSRIACPPPRHPCP